MKNSTTFKLGVIIGFLLLSSAVVLLINWKSIRAKIIAKQLESDEPEDRRKAVKALREFSEGRIVIVEGLSSSKTVVRNWCQRELMSWSLGGEWSEILLKWDTFAHPTESSEREVERLRAILREAEKETDLWRFGEGEVEGGLKPRF